MRLKVPLHFLRLEYCSTEEVRSIFFEKKYLLDPHTAVAHSAAKKYRARSSSDRKMLLFSTAHYGKFGQTVFSALHPETLLSPSESEILRSLAQEAKSPKLPDSFLQVLKKEKIHIRYIPNETSAMEGQILSFLNTLKK